MDCIDKFTHANRTVKVYLDPDPLNPRKEWDNGTIMLHWHRRYDLGDKRIDHMSAEEVIAQYAEDNDPVLAILPLNLYDHSGLSVSTGSYSCGFDSGQVGWVIITESKAKEMGWVDELQKEQPLTFWEERITCDVKTYDDYLTGQVYGYEVLGKDGDHLESCWGYVGCKDDCISDAKSAAEYSVDPGIERDAEELESRVTYASVC